MRKNTNDRKSVNGLYVTYQINGLNLDRFINYVKKQGVTLYDIKKITVKRLIVTVNFKDCQKFFAIANKMCYNIKKVKYKGWAYPFYKLFKSAGLLLGALFFIVALAVYDDFIVGIKFSGSGSVYHRQVREYLAENGVKEFSRFSTVDLKIMEDKVLAKTPYLSFVSLKKSGNVLNVELALSTEKVKTLSGNVYYLNSDVDGEIESVKVYRGRAMVKAGERVSVGDLIVDGVMGTEDQPIKTNVICSVLIIAEKQVEYLFDEPDAQEKAVVLACSELYDKEIVASFVNKTQVDDKYLYKVLIKYRHVLCVG